MERGEGDKEMKGKRDTERKKNRKWECRKIKRGKRKSREIEGVRIN